MRRIAVTTAAWVLLAAAPASALGETVDWSIQRGGSSDADKVQLTVDSRWEPGSQSSWSNPYRIADLRGLSAAQLASGAQPVRFALVREAGRLDCSGVAGGYHGSGACTFTPDEGFAIFLQARSIGRPNRHQAFSLTMSGVGRDLVDALDKSGFAKPNVDQLTAMGIHGATAEYVRALAGSGYRLSAQDLIAFRIHGVSPEYIREMGAIGPALRQIRPSDLVSLRIHGVKPEYVREMVATGPQFRNLTADDLVSFAIHGVRPALVQAYARYDRRPLAADDVVSMAIHGVSPDFINALAALGYRDMSADDLVALSIHGVTAEYVQSLQRAGMPRMSADQLVRLRLAGFQGRRN